MDMYGMTGERLGTIGQELAKSAPEWQKALLAKPSVLIRKSIARGYGSPYEDTSTLVLTASSGAFVDIRFALSANPTTDPAFWAFAGQLSTTFPHSEESVSMPYMAHCKWDHSIDSEGHGISDEGDMFLLLNGDCIEVGQTADSEGQVRLYKEYWTGAPGENKPSVVARSDTGIIIRIGNHCQGVARPQGQEHVIVERWFRSPGADRDAASWLKDWRSNTDTDEHVEVLLPCMWACGEQRKEGDEVLVAGSSWTVVEVIR